MANPCLTFFVGATLLLLFAGIATAYTAQQIQQECQACDTKALAAIDAYNTAYGHWSTAIDGAKYHCGRFAQAMSCYADCLHDTYYTYTSATKSVMDQLQIMACDPSCYYTVMPYCYLTTVGVNDPLKSCTGSDINKNLKACLQKELFVNQNCNNVCTQGQRFAHVNYFDTILLCTIPFATATDCFTWAFYCSQKVFGSINVDFVLYSNRTLIGSNQLACRHFADDYDTCVHQAVSGNVVIGTYPYSFTYNSPCAGFSEELDALVDYIRNSLVGPLCNNPSATLNDTCQPNAIQRTMTATNTGIQRTTTVGSTVRMQRTATVTTTKQAPSAPKHVLIVNRAASLSSFSTSFAAASLVLQAIAAVLLSFYMLK